MVDKMNPRVKALWVEALRSGEYEQGFGTLTTIIKNEDGTLAEQDCCYGVLCKLAIKDGVSIEVRDRSMVVPDKTYNGLAAMPPLIVMAWAQFPSESFITYKGAKWEPQQLNDHFRLSFKEIADLIEKQL